MISDGDALFQNVEIDRLTLSEFDGKLFHVLWGFICNKGYKTLREYDRSLVKWNEIDIAANSMMATNYVIDSTLAIYPLLIDSLTSPLAATDSENLLSLLEAYYPHVRPHHENLTLCQIERLKSWNTTRVEGPFWFVGCTEAGFVFVSLATNSRCNRMFIAKAVDNSYVDTLKQFRDEPRPGLVGTCIETIMLPWEDSIIFCGQMVPANLPPKEHIKQFEKLQNVIATCQRNGEVYTSLDPSLASFVERYQRVCDKDAFIPRLKLIPSTPGATQVYVVYNLWTPSIQRTKTAAEMEIEVAQNPQKFYDGVNYLFTKVHELFDGDICVMCDSGETFGACCKSRHQKRAKKSVGKGILLYAVNNMAAVDYTPDMPKRMINLSLLDYYTMKFKLSNIYEVGSFSTRCVESPHFLSNSKFGHDYLGPYPAPEHSQCGIVTFGTVCINPKLKEIEIRVHSWFRMVNLLKDLRTMIRGLKLSDATATAELVSGRFDKKDLNAGLAMVKTYALECTTDGKFGLTFTTGKADFVAKLSALSRTSFTEPACCGYCGALATDVGVTLSSCSLCLQQRYCSRECQKSHWRMHKSSCKQRKRSKGDKQEDDDDDDDENDDDETTDV